MAKGRGKTTQIAKALPKSPTGIQGLDEITGGGLPTGRPTLVCGSAGCGKTLLSMEFLVRGAQQQNEMRGQPLTLDKPRHVNPKTSPSYRQFQIVISPVPFPSYFPL